MSPKTLTFEFTPQEYANLMAIQKRNGLATMARAVGGALRVYALLTDYAKQNYKLSLKKKHGCKNETVV